METDLIWITKVEEKNNKYIIHFSNNVDSLTVTEDLVVKEKLVKGNAFTKKGFTELLQLIDLDSIFNKCLHYVSFQMRTEKEVRTYLNRFKISDLQKEEMIQKLLKFNYLNDDQYTKMFIETKVKAGLGQRAIEYQLKLKGISDDLISNNLLEIDENTLVDEALKVSEATLKKCFGEPIVKQKQAVFTRLVRMGHSQSTIDLVMSKLKYSPLDKNLLLKNIEKLKKLNLDDDKIKERLIQKGYTLEDIRNI